MKIKLHFPASGIVDISALGLRQTNPETLRYHDQVPEDDSRPDKGLYIDPATGDLMIRTLEGDMRATYGDYIIRGVQGEFYPCRSDIFAVTYEAVEGETPSVEEAESILAAAEPHLRKKWAEEIREGVNPPDTGKDHEWRRGFITGVLRTARFMEGAEE